MNKQELIDKLADRSGSTKIVVSRFLEIMTNVIQENVAAGNEVRIPGFGIFERKLYKSHVGRNPKTGDKIIVPETARPRFTPSVTFKKLVQESSQVKSGEDSIG